MTLREKEVEEADTAKCPVIFFRFNALANIGNLCKAFFYKQCVKMTSKHFGDHKEKEKVYGLS